MLPPSLQSHPDVFELLKRQSPPPTAEPTSNEIRGRMIRQSEIHEGLPPSFGVGDETFAESLPAWSVSTGTVVVLVVVVADVEFDVKRHSLPLV